MQHRWTEAELDFVRQNADRLTDAEIAASISRLTGRIVTMAAARKVRHRLKLKKMGGRNSRLDRG